jgi:hypothetical protein
MKKMKWIIFVVTLTLVASGVFAQSVVLIDQLVTARQIADVIESDRATPGEIAYAGDGKYYMVEETDLDNEKVFQIDTTTNPRTFTLVTDEAALKAKVDAVN